MEPPHAGDLTAEDLARLGPVERVVPYALSRAELAGQLATLSPLVLVYLMLWLLGQTGGFSHLARGPDPRFGWVGTILVPVCASALLVVCLGLISRSALHVWRTCGRSPGLVLGEHGLRVHGVWPWPTFLPWDQVQGASHRGDRVDVRADFSPGLHPALRALAWLFGEPAVVITQADAAAACERIQARVAAAGRPA